MTPSTTKHETVVEKLLNRKPQHEPEVAEAMEAYQEARAKSRETVMLALRYLDGRIESFSYAYLTRVRFTPDDVITMWFGRDEIQIKGRNLQRLCETITEHRTRFIQEGSETEDDLKSDDAAHIDEIIITELEEV